MAKLVKKKTILVVDDDLNARRLLRDILDSKRFDIVEAEDGKQALDILKVQHVDLLITDRNMPVMDGFALLKRLQDEKRMIPALMISAFGEEAMWAEAIGSGAQDYLLKPYKPEEVIRIVNKQLGVKEK